MGICFFSYFQIKEKGSKSLQGQFQTHESLAHSSGTQSIIHSPFSPCTLDTKTRNFHLRYKISTTQIVIQRSTIHLLIFNLQPMKTRTLTSHGQTRQILIRMNGQDKKNYFEQNKLSHINKTLISHFLSFLSLPLTTTGPFFEGGVYFCSFAF